MTTTTRAIAFLSLLVFPSTFLAGCAAEVEADGADDEEVVSEAELKAGESFKFYDTMNAQPSRSCDRHTRVTITKSKKKRGALVVSIVNKVTGGCEIYVAPNKMQFTVKQSRKDSCGSIPATGDGGRLEPVELSPDEPAGPARTPIKVLDNRTRVCEDLRAPIEITIGTGASARKLYAQRPEAPPASAVCRMGNQTYRTGQSFPSTDGCNSCTCMAGGSIACTELACAPQATTCRFGNRTYAEGDSFPSTDGCNSCTCMAGGSVACTELACR